MEKVLSFLKKHIVTFLKGIAVGATLRVPGMSGGTTAIILKIYDKLLHSVNNFFKDIKENILFLGVFSLGGGIAFLALNSVLHKATTTFPAISAYFIAGIIIFGVPALVKESGISYKFDADENSTKGKKIFIAAIKDLLPLIGGIAIVVVIGILQNQGVLESSDYSGFGQFLFNVTAGFFAGIAFILPGLSFTYFLTLIGLLDTFSESLSIASINFGFLTAFACGLILGFVTTAKALDKLIKKHKRGTYICIMGFLIGSVIMLLIEPKNVPKSSEIAFCVLFFVLGSALIVGLTFLAEYLSKRNKAINSEPKANEKNKE